MILNSLPISKLIDGDFIIATNGREYYVKRVTYNGTAPTTPVQLTLADDEGNLNTTPWPQTTTFITVDRA